MENTIVTRSALKASRKSITVTESDPPDPSPKRKLEETDPTPDDLPFSSKRAKNASQAFAKHSRFWALDGNVILQFGGLAFKVHRSRLALQSVWFEKLFERRAGREEPLESDEENIKDVVVEDLDGCDVYHLDLIGSVSDFEALLTAMDDSIEFVYSSPTFLTAAAIFRAASTFIFPKFYAFARKHLLVEFARDITEFCSTPIANASAAVNLGRSWNLPGILKRAFYELARAEPEDLDVDDSDDEGELDSCLQDLETDDIIRLVSAQKRLAAAWLSAFVPPVFQCPGSGRNGCVAMRSAGVWSALTEQLLRKYQYDPICGLDALIAVRWKSVHGYCDKCASAQKKVFMVKKVQVWEDMDGWFNVPGDDEDARGDKH
ncbi:hypothetical protein C8R44DRAFT_677346 [Mycena epipterygia]|nr:hypothetical protein C8R44DRAFT_677346 [Mycena epipterygia]